MLRRLLFPVGRVLIISGLWLSMGLKAADALSEYDVKAGFVFNFSRFVQWPEHALPATNDPLVIGILGADPFGPTLDELVRGEHVGDHPLTVQRFARGDDFTKCHI